MQPEGRQGREFRREIREPRDRVPKISEEPVAEPLERSPEVATRERSDRAAEGFTAKDVPEGHWALRSGSLGSAATCRPCRPALENPP